MAGWGTLEFSVSPTANSATDWPDHADDIVLILQPDKNVIVKNGSFGIGDTSPTKPLTVGTTAPVVLLDDQNSRTLEIRGPSSSHNATVLTTSNHDLLFGTNNVERARFNTQGRFGIGTNNPTAILHTYNSVSDGLHLQTSSYSSYAMQIQANDNLANGMIAGDLGLRGHSGIGFSPNAGTSTPIRIDSDGDIHFIRDGDTKIETIRSGSNLLKTFFISGAYTMSNTKTKSNNNSHPGTVEIRCDADGPALIVGQLGRSNVANAYTGIALSQEYPKCLLAHVSDGTSYGQGDFVIAINQNGDTSMATIASHERFRIRKDGKMTLEGDNDTYLRRNGSNTWQVYTNGTLCTEFSANQRVRMPQVYSTNGSNMRAVEIESDGTLCAGNTSIRAAKKNITPQSDVSWLYDLNPVTFNYRKKTVDYNTGENTYLDDVETEISYGLIAEEVESVKKDFCFYNTNSSNEEVLAGVGYHQLITPLLKALQDQKKEIDELKTEVAALKSS